jgi:hypothetical protein
MEIAVGSPDIGPVQIGEQRPGQLRGAGESPAEGVGQIVLPLSEGIEDVCTGRP